MYRNSICQSNQLILCKEVIGVCYDNYKNNVSTLCDKLQMWHKYKQL